MLVGLYTEPSHWHLMVLLYMRVFVCVPLSLSFSLFRSVVRSIGRSTPSAPSLVSIGEKGARFKSYHDCSIKSLTPERSIDIQRQLGADLIVVLGDEGGEGKGGS